MGVRLRTGLPRFSCGAMILLWATLGCAGTLSISPKSRDAQLLIQEARSAYLQGNPALAVARANQAIAIAPGDGLLAEAQLLIARSYYQMGEDGRSWDQYQLFLSNYPHHPASREALSRSAAIARRMVRSLGASPMIEWRVVTLAPDDRWTMRSRSVPDAFEPTTTGLVIAVGPRPDWSRVQVAVDRAAIEGHQVLLWMPLSDGETAFDPFDADQLTALDARFQTAAGLPIDGFVVGRDLFLGEEVLGAPSPEVIHAAVRSNRTLSGLRGRSSWQWAGMRARASADVLSRLVAGTRPGLRWMVVVSSSSVLRPWEAIVQQGQDIAEVLRRVPDISLVVVGTDDHAAVRGRLMTLGFPATSVVWGSTVKPWSPDGPYLLMSQGMEP